MSNVEKGNKGLLITIAILSILLIVGILTGVMFLKVEAENKEMLNNPNIYNNVFIQGINVSNMSKEEARIALESDNLDEKITLNYKEKQYVFNKSDFGVSLNKEQAITEAYNVGRTGSEKERIKAIKSLEENKEDIPISKVIEEEKAKEKLTEICKEIEIEPKNATLKRENGSFVVLDGNNGLKVDFETTYQQLEKALITRGDANIEIIAKETEPQYKASDLSKVQDNLGTFSTKYTNKGGSDNNRIINMEIAASRIDGTILYPGEVFSTNEKFGETTKANGYKPAPTILNGKFVDEYGGGVCQISSTLYNAVLYSEVDVVERQNHSLKVGYLDYGYDATLAGDYIDFKFKNSTNYPIYIESYVTDNEVVCSIYGYDERPDNRSLKFENALVEVIEPGPRVVKETEELKEGEEKVEVKPLKGYKYKLYKLVYVDGKLTEKLLVNNSYYKPRAEEVLVGTNKDKAQEVANIDGETITSIDDSTIIEENTENKTEPIITEETIETTNSTEDTISTDLTQSTTDVIETNQETSLENTEQIENTN